MSNNQAGAVVRRALAEAAAQLGTSSDTPRLDAELLMAHALGVSREELLLRHMDASAPPAFEALLARRRSGEPIAYITGRRAFWSIELEVGPGVLIPRPDSETLIEAAAHHFRGRAPARILDLGTGPGSLLLAAMSEWPDAAGLGVDRSAAALAFAERNARRLGLAARFVQSDWGDGVTGTFDLILCNPPYVEAGADLPRDVAAFEPAEALYAGPEGLDDYRRIAPRIGGLLAPGGLACIEIGAGQAEAVTALFGAEGLAVSARADLAGILRCLLVSR